MRNAFLFFSFFILIVSSIACGDDDDGATDASTDTAADAAADVSDDATDDATADAAPSACGTRGGGMCEATEFCDFAASCGADDSGGTCTPRPSGCPEDCPGVCGCDGMMYCNGCMANEAGVSVDPDGECAPMMDCAAQDARGQGPCDAFFGIGWDGTECNFVNGCSCDGADCESLFDSREECEARYGACT